MRCCGPKRATAVSFARTAPFPARPFKNRAGSVIAAAERAAYLLVERISHYFHLVMRLLYA